ncbi:hypothetical protein, partial [Chromobacterium haemolyticum]|uniref:hypothetical protein n=1 Tax=Chromobacterium haemolyticum TaxID=394935 RepID=UPI001EE65924
MQIGNIRHHVGRKEEGWAAVFDVTDLYRALGGRKEGCGKTAPQCSGTGLYCVVMCRNLRNGKRRKLLNLLHFYKTVLTCNQGVASSIPAAGT